MGNSICEGPEVGASLGHSGKSRKAGGGGGNMVGKLRADMEDGKKKKAAAGVCSEVGFCSRESGEPPKH